MVTQQLQAEITAGQGEKLTALTWRVPSYRNGRPATLSRLLRWAMHGIVGPNGERIYLEAIRTPGGWVSTAEALTRFYTAQTPIITTPTPTTAKPRSKSQRQRAAERTARKLEQAGV